MATAVDILASMSSIEDRTLVIDNDLRTITIPPTVTNLGVENDDDVLRLYFRMPRMCGDTDLTDFDVHVLYVNANGEDDKYPVDDVQCDETGIAFSWLVGDDVVAYKGYAKFSVCLKKLDSRGVTVKAFHTTLAQLPVLEGLEITD